MKRISFASIISLALTLSTTHAHATTLHVSSNLGNHVYVNQAKTGNFDIVSQLVPSIDYVAPYQISNASVSFLFADDANDAVITTEYYTPYTPTAVTSRLHVIKYTDPAETASLNIGSQSASGATTKFTTASHLTGITTDWNYYANNCPGYTGACNHQLFQGSTHTYEEAVGYTGNFELTYLLNATNLAILANTGKLDFSLGITGDLLLQSATLTFDIAQNPAAIQSPVPLPSSFSLLLSGLAVLGLFFRQRHTFAFNGMHHLST